MNALLISLALSAPSLRTQDQPLWPEYRGPGLDGHAPAGARLPLRWSEDENVVWKTPIRGRGWSSPVTAEGRIWLTTADPEGHRLAGLCVDLETGEVLLDRVLFEVEEPQDRNDLNSYASPSPVVEPGRVYLCFGNEGLACLDTKSFEEVWRRTDLNCDHMEGPGSSPLLLDDRLVIHVDGGDVQYVTALDKRTGETLWTTDRTVDLEPFPADLRKAYSTPVPVRDGERQILVSTGAQATYGYDAADGTEVWRIRHKGFSQSSRAVIHGDLALISTGFMRAELWALRLGGEGDVTDSHVAWKLTKGIATMPSPVLVDGGLFVVSDGGIVSCLDPGDGTMIWRERMATDTCASLLSAGDRIYLFDRAGTTVVFAADGEPRVLAENELEQGCMASPAVAGDALVLRTKTHLYKLEEASEER